MSSSAVVPSSSSGTTSSAYLLLRAELEEERNERSRLEAREKDARARFEAATRRCDALVHDEEAARRRSQALEVEVMKLRQEVSNKTFEKDSSIRSLMDDFAIERETLLQTAKKAEEFLAVVRGRERAAAERVMELESQLASLSESSGAEPSATGKRKRRRREGDEENEGEEEDADEGLVRGLRTRVAELEATLRAASAGAAVSGRAQELAEELAQSMRRERRAREELESFRRDRENEDSLADVQARLARAKAQVERLQRCESERDALLAERERWIDVLPGCDTPSAAAKCISELRRDLATQEGKIRQLESELAASQDQATTTRDKLLQTQTSLETASRSEARLTKSLEEKAALIEKLQAERNAAERVMRAESATMTAVVHARAGVTAKAGGEEEAVKSAGEADAKIHHLAQALEAARAEASEALRSLEKAEIENDRLVKRLGKGAYDSDTTKVLHIKPMKRADYVPPVEPPPAHHPAASQSSAISLPPATPAIVDQGEKRRERLKEMFQKQITLFKEAVYLLLGLKIDMTPDVCPQLRVRSMFAESPDDYLLFRMDPASSSLELLETDYTDMLSSQSIAFTALTRCNNVPVFLANLTLELFERQTFVGPR